MMCFSICVRSFFFCRSCHLHHNETSCLLLMAEIPNNHLVCITPLKTMGINYPLLLVNSNFSHQQYGSDSRNWEFSGQSKGRSTGRCDFCMVFTVQFDRRLRREVRKAHRFEANLVAGRAPKTTARVDKSTWTYPCNWGFTGSGSATMNQAHLWRLGPLRLWQGNTMRPAQKYVQHYWVFVMV